MALPATEPTWFSFLDRSLRYDCISCGSFGDAAAALEDVPAALRAMALTQFDQAEAELEFA